MKLFLTSNTNFGYKTDLTYKKWLYHMTSYFNDELYHNIQKFSTPDDIFIHMGNLFYGQNLSFQSISSIIGVFEKLSKIIPCYFLVNQNDINTDDYNINSFNLLKNIHNIHIITEKTIINDILFIPHTNRILEELEPSKYICFNFDYQNHPGKSLIEDSLKQYHKAFCGSYTDTNISDIINVGTPYPLYKTNKYGLVIYDTLKDKSILIENKSCPKYITLNITSDDDLKVTEDIKNDVTEIIIDNNYFDKNKIPIDIFIRKHDIKKVSIRETDKMKEEREIFEVCEENFNLNELIENKIKSDPNLLKEFKNILEIYSRKK